MPEPTAVKHSAVGFVVLVVVAVIRGEHHPVVVSQSIASIALVPGYHKLVVARFGVHNQRTVLDVIPAEIGT